MTLRPTSARRALRAGGRVLLLVAALVLTPAPPASAASAPEVVRERVLAGDFEGARAVLLDWQPATPAEAERRLWLLAVVYRESGQDHARLRTLEELVTLRPDVARFRLELADTLAALGQRDRAAYHYELARGGDLSTAQRDHAEAEADRMAEPTPWSGSFGLALVPSSNPGRKTQEETLDLGFGQAVLSADSRAEPATGLAMNASIAYAHRFLPDMQGQLGLRLNSEVYEDSDDNDLTGVVEVALMTRLAPGTLLRTTLSFQQRYLGGDVYSHGPGLSFYLMQRSGDRGRIGAGLSLTDLTYPDAPGADGLRSLATLSYDHALSSTLTLRGSLAYERVDAAVAEIAARSWTLGVGASQAFRGGLILDADLRLRRSERDGRHGLFGVVQQDERETLSLKLRHSEVSWRGFAPYVQLTAERQHSNIALYSYTARDLALGLTRRF